MVRAKRTVDNRAATDPKAARADVLQVETDEGPCLDAVRHHSLVHSPSLAYDPRWPTWGPRVVAETGLQSVMSLQLFTHNDTLGALNMFAFDRDSHTAGDRYDAIALAAHITVAIAAAEEIDNLTAALGTGTVIGTAVGFVMGRYRLAQVEAFAVLSRLSTEHETKIRDLAVSIVETGALPPRPRRPAGVADDAVS